eukprot:NODE_1653_length_780_cov_166.078101_g1604_i0.p1 GENE.NODE_1653_length_780_cov_166.078101_g1604_i0~~NODE_1653_length_780_cov_166.078101_g1604_i0.p1  ORF type:complete len:216 (+),score=46.86 NODE_1653_length_780_cov_166.078101_g1604_i0:83-730(+)
MGFFDNPSLWKLLLGCSAAAVGVYLLFKRNAAPRIASKGKVYEGIEYIYRTSGNLDAEEDCFVLSFSKAYAHLSKEQLKLKGTLEEFLREAFADEKERFAKLGSMKNEYFLSARRHVDGQVVGFVSIGVNDGNAYLHQMAVHPDFQGRHIGKRLVFAILDKDPSVDRITILARRTNLEAVKFYSKLGFEEVEFEKQHADLSPELYLCMKWHKSKL